MGKKKEIDVKQLIIRDYKDIVDKKQLQEMLMTADVLIEDVDTPIKSENLKLLGYNEIKDIKFKTQSPEYLKFLVKENNFTFINLQLQEKDKRKDRIMTYIYRQDNHDYDIIIWIDTIKNNWFKRIFKKNIFKAVELKLFYKGDICDELKQLI